MKKVVLSLLLVLLLAGLGACHRPAVVYTDNEPFVLDIEGDTLKILQLTDFHLTFGIDYNDRKTFRLIEKLAAHDTYDLIVITGDLTMSPSALRLFRQTIRRMEAIGIPWTFVFGNHENDFHRHEQFIRHIGQTEHLLFKVGPELEEGGFGNFKITFTKDGNPFYHAYFLDSHSEVEDYTPEQGKYGYFSTAQVAWYRDLVKDDAEDSVVFTHIPLRQFIDPVDYDGIFNEDQVYAQGIDTGFFDAMLEFDRSRAVFVGHDHLNDFSFFREGILLAYGRITGYNAYGNLERGGRVIEIDDAGTLTTYILLESEVWS